MHKRQGGNIFDDIENFATDTYNKVAPVVEKVAPIVAKVAPIVMTMAGGKAVAHCGNCYKRVAKNAKKCKHCHVHLGGNIFGSIADFAKNVYNKSKDVYEEVEPYAKPAISAGMTAYSLYKMLQGAGIIKPEHEKHFSIDNAVQKQQSKLIEKDSGLEKDGYNDRTKFNYGKFHQQQKNIILRGGNLGEEEDGGDYDMAGSYPVGGGYRVGGKDDIVSKYRRVGHKKSEIMNHALKNLPKH